MWHYQAQLSRVVDGDTQDLVADLGFHMWHHVRVRLQGVDTAEVHGVSHGTDEYALGRKQSEFVREWYADAFVDYTTDPGEDDDWPLHVRTETVPGKYGRWIAQVTRKSDGEMLNEALIERWPSVASDDDA